MVNETRTWKNEADKAFDELCDILDDGRYLDHEIRAVEWARTKRGSYSRPYTIIRKQTDSLSWDGKRGSALLFEHGAQIWYLKEGTRLQKMIVIGHELGHIYLSHLNLDGEKNSDNLSTNKYLETQATYFAKQIVSRRSNLFNDKEYITERQFSNQTIEDRVKDFQSDYDELMPDRENKQ